MGGVFIFFYIAFIFAVVCFLVYLFKKYLDFHIPEKVKRLFFKIPKSKETIEKLKEYLVKADIPGSLKSLAANLKSAISNHKSSRNLKLPKEGAKVLSSNYNASFNNSNYNLNSEIRSNSNYMRTEALRTDNHEYNREPYERVPVKRIEEEQSFKEEKFKEEKFKEEKIKGQRVIIHEPINTNPVTVFDTMSYSFENTVQSAVPDTVPISRSNPIQSRPFVVEKEPVKLQTIVERLAEEKSFKEMTEQNIKKLDKFKPSKKKKNEIVQTGFASIFFSRSYNVTVIPYARDLQGKGRAMDGIAFLKYPLMPDELGRAVVSSINIDDDANPYSDKELVKKLDVKEWEDFTYDKKHISIKYDKSCGFILNTTTRNPDGSYRLNCPGGIEKIVRKDATLEELGDTVLKLLEKCKI